MSVVGRALDRRWSRTAGAAAAGEVSWDQAGVLVRCLEALPEDLDPALVAAAEAHLLTEAARFGPGELCDPDPVNGAQPGEAQRMQSRATGRAVSRSAPTGPPHRSHAPYVPRSRRAKASSISCRWSRA